MINIKKGVFTFSKPFNIFLSIIILSILMAYYDWNSHLSMLKYSKPLLTSITALYVMIGFAGGSIIAIIASFVIPFFNVVSFFNIKSFYLYYLFSKLLVLIFISIVVAESIFVFSGPTPGETFFFPQKNPTKTNKNLILITIDALRSKNLSSYGYNNETAPFIDTIAKNAILFSNCISQSSKPLPAYASMLTSKYPFEHWVDSSENGIISSECPDIRANLLPDIEETLAEVLSEKGYLTSAFIANRYINSDFKLNQGFDFYNDNLPPFIKPMVNKLFFLKIFTKIGFIKEENSVRIINRVLIPLINKLYGESFEIPSNIDAPMGKRAREINSEVFKWLHSYGEYNFFLLINYFDPSWPYDAPSPYNNLFAGHYEGSLTGYTTIMDSSDLNREDLQHLINLYDAETAYVDSQIEELFEKIEMLKIKNNTIVIITSPHGEEFGEHGFIGHGRTLYSELINVPLIIWDPEKTNKPLIIDEQVETIDIMPTIMDLLNIDPNKHLSGNSLLPLINSTETSNASKYAFSQVLKNDLLTKMDSRYGISSVCLRTPNWKYILNSSGEDEMYNIILDEKETVNLASKEQEQALFFKKEIASILADSKASIKNNK